MKLEEQLRELIRQKERVELAHLFGSAARGRRGKLSDVDVAVHLDT